MTLLRFLTTLSFLALSGLGLAGCQSTGDEQGLSTKTEQAPTPSETIPHKVVKKVASPPAREAANGTEAPAEDAQANPPPAPAPAPPPPPEQPAISNQQIDRYLADGQVTYERAAKLRYREATRLGQVKTKADHAYWSTIIEIYRNWDNRYISWDEAQKRLAAAEAAHQGQ